MLANLILLDPEWGILWTIGIFVGGAIYLSIRDSNRRKG